MRAPRQYQMKVVMTTSLFCALCCFVFLVVQQGTVQAWFVPGAGFGGILVASGICALRFHVIPRLLSLPLLAAVLTGAIGYLLTLAAAFVLTAYFVQMTFGGMTAGSHLTGQVADTLLSKNTRIGFLWACVGVLFVSASVQLSDKLGPGVFWRWILGWYRRPRVEERVFVFVDLNGSTQLAESLGDIKFSALLRDFLNELSVFTHQFHGEVAVYVGDGALLTWKLRDARLRAQCVRLVFELDERFRQQSSVYESLYGAAPEFKAGAHCGSVVVTEVGRIRSDFVYHGDTVNVASRIASLCSSEGKQFLVSESLLGQLELPDWCLSESIGQRELRGKSEMPNLFEVKRRPTGHHPLTSEGSVV